MSERLYRHRLDGLEADNLLAFLALLGLLRALETARPQWRPRAAWDLDHPPLRPVLCLAETATREALCETATAGIKTLVATHDFAGATDLKLDASEARLLCSAASNATTCEERYFADLLAALVCDAATGRDPAQIEPTPLAYPSVATSNFLKNFLVLSQMELPEKRSRDPSYPKSAAACIEQALFAPWQRFDRPVGLRWDPEEASRYAYQWRAPTKELPRTQHGAHRLAIVGLSVLTCAPVVAGTRVQLAVIGGAGGGDRFTIAWPIWRQPASLAAIRALLAHPRLREPGGLTHLGVDHVRVARRISLERFRNYTYAAPLRHEG
jgi:hypothetical protein